MEIEKTYHFCVDIRGLLENKRNLRKAVGMITVDGKRLDTVEEVKDFLYDQLGKGRKVLPLGECDNFDYLEGCKGHNKKSESGELSDGKH